MSLEHIVLDKTEAWELIFAISRLHRERLKTMNFVVYRPIKGILDRLDSGKHVALKAIFEGLRLSERRAPTGVISSRLHWRWPCQRVWVIRS